MEFIYYIDFVIIFTSVVVVGKKISFLFISHSFSWERVITSLGAHWVRFSHPNSIHDDITELWVRLLALKVRARVRFSHPFSNYATYSRWLQGVGSMHRNIMYHIIWLWVPRTHLTLVSSSTGYLKRQQRYNSEPKTYERLSSSKTITKRDEIFFGWLQYQTVESIKK